MRSVCRRASRGSSVKTLEGKVVVVTGAARGIGRASALLFAAEGAAVVALDRATEVEATVSSIRTSGGRAVALIRDSSTDEDVAGAVAFAVEEYGGLDVCFADAGISGGRVPVFQEKAGGGPGVLRGNLVGAFPAAQHSALSVGAKGRGSII